MQLAVPNALLWLLLALPILLLYLLKLRLRRMPVSTVMFWEQVFEQHKPRAIWQRLRQIVSLILQLLFLSLLSFALANPLFQSQLNRSRRIVVVMDNSASMSSTDVSPSRFGWAKQRAERLIKELRDGDQMAIISTANATVESGLTDHRRSLRTSLSSVAATDAPARTEQSLRVARRLVAEHGNAEIILLTDRDSDAVKDFGEVEVVTCGSRAANRAITQFQVRRNFDDLVGFQVLVEVGNFADEAVSLRLELTLDDDLLDVIPLELAADEVRTLVLDYANADGGKLIAEIDQEDVLASDNRAVAVVSPRPLQPVILVTPGSLFLQSALAAIPQVEVTISEQLPAAVPDATIVIVHRTRLDRVPAGDVFVIDPISDSDLWQLRGTVVDPIVAAQDSTSPLMTHVNLQNVLVPGARQLDFNATHQTLAESLDGSPLYLASRRPDARLLLLTADLLRSDLPLRTAFPILMSNAINWFQDESGELQAAIATGSTTQLTLASLSDTGPNAKDREWQLIDPAGATRTVKAGKVVIGPLDRCGFYTLQATDVSTSPSAGSAPLIIACNVANRSESDVRRSPNPEQPVAQAGWGGRPIWFYLTIAALLLSAIEWYLYQRRWVG